MPAGRGPEAGASAGALRSLLAPGALSWMSDTVDAGAAAGRSAVRAGAVGAAAASLCCNILDAEQGPAAETRITRTARTSLRPIGDSPTVVRCSFARASPTDQVVSKALQGAWFLCLLATEQELASCLSLAMKSGTNVCLPSESPCKASTGLRDLDKA